MTDEKLLALMMAVDPRCIMTDDEWIKKVKKMNLQELFAEVMAAPEFLTDGYYRNLGDALRNRYNELTKE